MIAEFKKFEREISLKQERNKVADEVNVDWESTKRENGKKKGRKEGERRIEKSKDGI